MLKKSLTFQIFLQNLSKPSKNMWQKNLSYVAFLKEWQNLATIFFNLTALVELEADCHIPFIFYSCIY